MSSALLAAGSSSRRHFLRQIAAGGAILAGVLACQRRQPLLRVAHNVWPGYALLGLAAARGYFAKDVVRLIEMPSATACIHGLAAGTLEAACLTLDEVLTALAGGIALNVVCVLDVSRGADVLLARPELRTLSALEGNRIGVEQSAVGAVMLAAVLEKAGLKAEDVVIVHTPLDRQREVFISGQVDALITFEPVTSQLQGTQMRRLFSSADIPGRIVDVLAVRPVAAERSPQALRQLLAGHFRARAEFIKEPAAAASILAGLLNLRPEQIAAAYAGIDLPDVAGNQRWLHDGSGGLARAADELARVMLRANLLPGPYSTDHLADGRFLPRA